MESGERKAGGGWIADQRGRKIVLLGASLCARGNWQKEIATKLAGLSEREILIWRLTAKPSAQPNCALTGERVGKTRQRIACHWRAT